MKNTSHTFQVMAILENTNLYFSLFTFHLSNSLANPLQIPFKSHSGMGE